MRGIMRPRRRIVLSIVLLLAGTFTLGPAYSDGYMSHAQASVSKKPPEIPYQRAVLSYRDGYETMVVESWVRDEATEFAWIVPVPEKPSKLEQGSAAMLESFSSYIQPRILLGSEFPILEYLLSPLVVLNVLFWALSVVLYRRTPEEAINGRLLAFSLIYFVVFFLCIPRLGGRTEPAGLAGYRKVSGVTLDEAKSLGNLDVVVLSPQSAEGLATWIAENGFAELPADALDTVSSYISEHWHFVVAKLRGDAKKVGRPTPLQIRFPSDRIIYPMRLTKSTAADVYLEAFVISDKSVTCPNLLREYSADFHSDVMETMTMYHWGGQFSFSGPLFFNKELKQAIALPAAMNLMWDGCVLTKLSGTLHPREMGHDYVFREEPLRSPFQYRFFSPEYARRSALYWAASFWILGTILVAWLWARRCGKTDNRLLGASLVFLLVPILSVAVGGVWYWAIPKTDYDDTFGPRFYWMQYSLAEGWPIAESQEVLRGMPLDEIKKWFADNYGKGDKSSSGFFPDSFSGYADVTDRYAILEDARGVVLRAFEDTNPSSWICIGCARDTVVVPAALRNAGSSQGG